MIRFHPNPQKNVRGSRGKEKCWRFATKLKETWMRTMLNSRVVRFWKLPRTTKNVWVGLSTWRIGRAPWLGTMDVSPDHWLHGWKLFRRPNNWERSVPCNLAYCKLKGVPWKTSLGLGWTSKNSEKFGCAGYKLMKRPRKMVMMKYCKLPRFLWWMFGRSYHYGLMP